MGLKKNPERPSVHRLSPITQMSLSRREGFPPHGRTETVCCRVLQGVAGCCRVLQCIAACCRVLQYVAVRSFRHTVDQKLCEVNDREHVLCAAVCCSVLQCVAVCCSVLQCVAVCCSVLQCVAVCCSVL